MRLTRLLEGEDLAKVVRRMYRSEVKGGIAEAERLVTAANPHLADAQNVRPGMVVILPEVEGTKAVGDSSDSPLQALASMLESALKAIGDLRSVTDAGISRQEKSAASTLDLLKTREVQALAGQDPEARKRVAAIQQKVTDRQKSLSTLRSLQKNALSEFQSDSEALLAFLSGNSSSTGRPG